MHLARGGMADHEFFEAVDAEADELAARFRAFCVAIPVPPPGTDVQLTSTPNRTIRSRQQQAEFLAYLAGFEDEEVSR